MEKLTLKEISGYSHTDLKFTCPERYNFGGMITDLEEVTLKCAYEGWIMFKEVPGFYPIEHFKPIVHSLEVLTKTIVHNGVEIIPLFELQKLDCGHIDWINNERNHWIKKYGHSHWLGRIPYVMIQKLYEWHFDIHGLIERGLAIDKSKI